MKLLKQLINTLVVMIPIIIILGIYAGFFLAVIFGASK